MIGARYNRTQADARHPAPLSGQQSKGILVILFRLYRRRPRARNRKNHKKPTITEMIVAVMTTRTGTSSAAEADPDEMELAGSVFPVEGEAGEAPGMRIVAAAEDVAAAAGAPGPVFAAGLGKAGDPAFGAAAEDVALEAGAGPAEGPEGRDVASAASVADADGVPESEIFSGDDGVGNVRADVVAEDIGVVGGAVFASGVVPACEVAEMAEDVVVAETGVMVGAVVVVVAEPAGGVRGVFAAGTGPPRCVKNSRGSVPWAGGGADFGVLRSGGLALLAEGGTATGAARSGAMAPGVFPVAGPGSAGRFEASTRSTGADLASSSQKAFTCLVWSLVKGTRTVFLGNRAGIYVRVTPSAWGS